MAAPVYAQPNIRAQLSILSSPPVAPIDINTGAAPKFWRAASIEIDVGIFDGSETGLDLSNLDSLQLTLAPTPGSPVIWLTKTVLARDISSPVDYGDWVSGLNQNARFILSPSDTDLGLQAGSSRQFWMAITGFTSDGGVIVYGGGYVTIFNPGSVYPPPAPANLVSYHSQNNASGNVTVAPTSCLHTEQVNVNGSAGTRGVLLQAAGYPQGAQVELEINFAQPLVAGIVINVYSESLMSSPIFSWTTDGYQPNAWFKATVNASLGYDPVAQAIPAHIP